MDRNGETIRAFRGNGGKGHYQNFIDAIRASDPGMLVGNIETGHVSSTWCELANIAFRVGRSGVSYDLPEPVFEPWRVLLGSTDDALRPFSLELSGDEFLWSGPLSVDKAGDFTGEFSEPANRFFQRRYRDEFVFPEFPE